MCFGDYFERDEDLVRGDLVARRHADLVDCARSGRVERVEHLHRFDHHDRVAAGDVLAGADGHVGDGARERGDDGAGVTVALRTGRRPSLAAGRDGECVGVAIDVDGQRPPIEQP